MSKVIPQVFFGLRDKLEDTIGDEAWLGPASNCQNRSASSAILSSAAIRLPDADAVSQSGSSESRFLLEAVRRVS